MKRSTIAWIAAFVALIGAVLTVIEQWHKIEPWLITDPRAPEVKEAFMHMRTLLRDGDYAQAFAIWDDKARKQFRTSVLQNPKKYEMFGIRISPHMSDLELLKAIYSVYSLNPAKVTAVRIDGDIATLTVVESGYNGVQDEGVVKMKRNGDKWLIDSWGD